MPSVAPRRSLETRRPVRGQAVRFAAPRQLDVHRLLAVRQCHRVRLEIRVAGALEPQALLPVLRWQELARKLLAGVLVVPRQLARNRLDLGRLGADPRRVEALLRGDLPRAGRAAADILAISLPSWPNS